MFRSPARFLAVVLSASLALNLSLPASAVAAGEAPAGIACAHAQPGVEASICAHPDLLQAGRRIAIAFARLRGAFQGDDATGFVAGQKSWPIERNNCSNAKATGEFPDVDSCLARRMEQRASLLEQLAPTHEALMTTVASYRFYDGSYTYRPAHGYTGTDGFVYMVSDGRLSATATVSLNVVANGGCWNGQSVMVAASAQTYGWSAGTGGYMALRSTADSNAAPTIDWQGDATTAIGSSENVGSAWWNTLVADPLLPPDDLAAQSGLSVKRVN